VTFERRCNDGGVRVAGAFAKPSKIKFQSFASVMGQQGYSDLSATDIAVQYANLTVPLTTMLGNGSGLRTLHQLLK
jgi:hypothetical protein